MVDGFKRWNDKWREQEKNKAIAISCVLSLKNCENSQKLSKTHKFSNCLKMSSNVLKTLKTHKNTQRDGRMDGPTDQTTNWQSDL